jgi:hypothetical protein
MHLYKNNNKQLIEQIVTAVIKGFKMLMNELGPLVLLRSG